MVICFYLSQCKGLAVGALFFGWVGFVGAYLNGRKTAVLTALAVVCAGGNGAADRFVGSAGLAVVGSVAIAVHVVFLRS